jgi:hypothetical protein
MDENSKSNANETPEEKATELTPEELNKVAGGAGQPLLVPAVQQHEEGWIEVNSFQWGTPQ